MRGGRRRFWRRKTVGRPVVNSTATGRLDGKSKYFVNFGERRKRKGFGNFVMEARVDELCSPLQNGSEMKYIWRERNDWKVEMSWKRSND